MAAKNNIIAISLFEKTRTVMWNDTGGGTIYLFLYSLFNDAFIISDYTASNERMIANNELERMWKEAAVA
jgi:hypothetical protein